MHNLAQPKRVLYTLLVLAISTGANTCFAVPEKIPAYSVVPELNDLNVAYLVRQDRIKISLYVINHEKFTITCDTEYQGGPDKKSSVEQNITPEKAVNFTYDYSRDTTSVVLYLQCIKSSSDTSPADATHEATEEKNSKASSVIETDISLPH